MGADQNEHQGAEEEPFGKTIPKGRDGVGLGVRKDPSTFEPEEDPDKPDLSASRLDRAADDS